VFEALEQLDWQDCQREYTRVEQQVRALTEDLPRRSQIYRVLWKHGGRCDCTTAFSIVKRPDVRATVEQEIQAVLGGA
jgi:hypothetical protein